MSIYPPNTTAPKKGLNYMWNYLGSSLKTLAAALSPYLGGDTGVKRYKALLNQSGTNAPVATILENTLGGVPVWTRMTDGQYLCTLANAFPQNKTFCNLAYGSEYGIWPMDYAIGIANDQGDAVKITFFDSGQPSDPNNDPGNDICVLIEVYP